MIKGVLLDYGGTIDTDGLHWAVVLKTGYQNAGIELPDEIFKKAYAFGERSLAIQPVVKPSHNFRDVLQLKIKQQFSFLNNEGYQLDAGKIEQVADDCNRFALATIDTAIPTLDILYERFPLIMVSNFYGNLPTVLEDFGIRKYFQHVVESAVVGVRKPDPAIYALAVKLTGFAANECAVVGDSFGKDIVPAKKTGCYGVWLNKKGWEEDAPTSDVMADAEIGNFAEVIGVLDNLERK